MLHDYYNILNTIEPLLYIHRTTLLCNVEGNECTVFIKEPTLVGGPTLEFIPDDLEEGIEMSVKWLELAVDRPTSAPGDGPDR